MKLPRISLAGLFAAILLTSSLGLHAQASKPAPSPAAASAPDKSVLTPTTASVFIELTEAGAGTPTVVEIPRKFLTNSPPATPVAAFVDFLDGSPGTSAIAAVALSAALIFGGLHLFRQKRVLKAPAMAMAMIGLLALTASLAQGDIAPPSVRHPPTVAGHVTVKVVEDGTNVHIVVSRELLAALLKQPPVTGQK